MFSTDILRPPIKSPIKYMYIDHEKFINSTEKRITYKIKTNNPTTINKIQSNSSIEFVGNKITIATVLSNQHVKYLILEPDVKSSITFNFKENSIISLTNIFISSLLNTIKFTFNIYSNTELRIQKSTWNLSTFSCSFYQYGNCHYIINSKQFPGNLFIKNSNSETKFTSNKNILEFNYLFIKGNAFFDFPEESKLIIKALLIYASHKSTIDMHNMSMNVETVEFSNISCKIISGPIYLNKLSSINSEVTVSDIVGIGEYPLIVIRNEKNTSFTASSILNFKTKISYSKEPEVDQEITLFRTKESMALEITNSPFNSKSGRIIGFKTSEYKSEEYHEYKYTFYYMTSLPSGRKFSISNLTQLNEIQKNLVFSETPLELSFLSTYDHVIYLNNFSNFCNNLQISCSSLTKISITDSSMIEKIIISNVSLVNSRFYTEILDFRNSAIDGTSDITVHEINVTGENNSIYSLKCQKLKLFPINFINLTEETIVYDKCVVKHSDVQQCVFFVQKDFDLFLNYSKVDKFSFKLKKYGHYTMELYQQANSPSFFRNCVDISTKFNYGIIPSSFSLSDTSYIVNSKGYYAVSHLYFQNKAELNSEIQTFIKASKLALELEAVYKKNNVTIAPFVLELNSVTTEMNDEISATHVILEFQSYNKFKSIKNVSTININISLSQVPFLYVENLQVKNEKLKISCFNLVSSEQIFGEDMIQNISIDVVCFNQSNVKEFQVLYRSEHWQFDNDTREFDIFLRDRGDHQCFAIEKRESKQNNSSPKKNYSLYIVFSVLVAVIIILIALVTFYVAKWRKKNSINSFMSSEISHTDLTQGLI